MRAATTTLRTARHARSLAAFAPQPLGPKSASLVARESKVGAENYAPLPVVLAKGDGCRVWDADGEEYLDFLSAYSAVNQGHCHPRLVQAMTEQAQVTESVRARSYYLVSSSYST